GGAGDAEHVVRVAGHGGGRVRVAGGPDAAIVAPHRPPARTRPVRSASVRAGFARTRHPGDRRAGSAGRRSTTATRSGRPGGTRRPGTGWPWTSASSAGRGTWNPG